MKEEKIEGNLWGTARHSANRMADVDWEIPRGSGDCGLPKPAETKSRILKKETSEIRDRSQLRAANKEKSRNCRGRAYSGK